MTETGNGLTVLKLSDPRTGAFRAEVADSRELEIDAAVAASRRAAASWSRVPARERATRLIRLADAIEAKADVYVQRECAGTGKPEAEAVGEVAEAADLFRFYAGAARAELTPASGHRIARHESWVRWEPLGVVGAIVPWNYPLLMAAWRCAPALAAGNTVVLKPAETTPDSAMLLHADAQEILGVDVLQTVTGGRETGRLLVRSAIDAIAFTGSMRGGQDVARQAGIRRISLELGGNCPAVVLADAPSFTWAELARAVTYNAGQSCAAPARVITLRDHFDEVVAQLSEAMAARRAGADFGPLNNPDQLHRYDRLVEGADAQQRKDGQVAVTGQQSDGYWRPPCVLAGLEADDPAVIEEIFGPVLTVQAAESMGEALRLANSVPQALAASVWTGNLDDALTLARGINAGEVWVNCHLVQTAELPHSGRGASGGGTDLSVLALAEYQRPKTVTVRVDTSVDPSEPQ